MIQNPTVFIVGAGASHPYGFPLGQGLVDLILGHAQGSNSPFHRALNLGSLQGIEDFRTRLRGSAASSIDAFLEGNEDRFIRIGKAAIAYCILQAEAQCLANESLLDNPTDDHWLKYLWNLARAGCTAATLGANKVSFVTYNYDRLLETYFRGVIQHSFNVTLGEAAILQQKAFPVIHLHGEISTAPFGYFDENALVNELPAYAQGIRVIHDSQVSHDNAFKLAEAAILNARTICFLGFGYHPVNLKRLPVTSSTADNAMVYGSTYGMGRAEIAALKGYFGYHFLPGDSISACRQFLRDTVTLV